MLRGGEVRALTLGTQGKPGWKGFIADWFEGLLVLCVGLFSVWLAALIGLSATPALVFLLMVAFMTGFFGASRSAAHMGSSSIILFTGFLFGQEFFQATGPDAESNFSGAFSVVAPVLLLVAAVTGVAVFLGGGARRFWHTRRRG